MLNCPARFLATGMLRNVLFRTLGFSFLPTVSFLGVFVCVEGIAVMSKPWVLGVGGNLSHAAAYLCLCISQVESSSSGFTPSGAGASVSMVCTVFCFSNKPTMNQVGFCKLLITKAYFCQIASRKPTDGASSSNCVTDISHLVRKKVKFTCTYLLFNLSPDCSRG